MKVSILGAGSWGTALAIHLARSGHDVLLWARDEEVASRIARERRHPRRLSSYEIPAGVRTTTDLAEAFDHSETVLLSVPCAAMREVLDAAPAPNARTRRFVSTAKGIEPDSLKRMTEIVLERYPSASVAALSGPTFADGVARGDPSAAVIADRGESFARDLQRQFSNSELRLYSSSDVIGVELSGALKNVIAIAAGITTGLGYGPNTLAALVTRGLAEIGRIVRAFGGEARTIHGLAGMGDLMLTATGRQSRNRHLGEEIGRGRHLADVLVEMPEVAEGARTCLAIPTIAARAGVEAPISDVVVAVLYEGCGPREGVERLMTRALRSE
ncbi:MAG TPA: NAD(P)H-dependent glycerol-3-phosphate dehydrogenase [Thermoanaerobaculia bacterium]|nr:NAD(P)H-dependent glycerol-3-phosphate dehydrogenase [Thermoanaerobaculia bacterium]